MPDAATIARFGSTRGQARAPLQKKQELRWAVRKRNLKTRWKSSSLGPPGFCRSLARKRFGPGRTRIPSPARRAPANIRLLQFRSPGKGSAPGTTAQDSPRVPDARFALIRATKNSNIFAQRVLQPFGDRLRLDQVHHAGLFDALAPLDLLRPAGQPGALRGPLPGSLPAGR